MPNPVRGGRLIRQPLASTPFAATETSCLVTRSPWRVARSAPSSSRDFGRNGSAPSPRLPRQVAVSDPKRSAHFGELGASGGRWRVPSAPRWLRPSESREGALLRSPLRRSARQSQHGSRLRSAPSGSSHRPAANPALEPASQLTRPRSGELGHAKGPLLAPPAVRTFGYGPLSARSP